MLFVAIIPRCCVSIRQGILDSFEGSYDEPTDLKIMDRLYPVEDMISSVTYETDADKRAGRLILLEDTPDRWDNFQCNLFARMQQFS
jgi:hypothetical protein